MSEASYYEYIELRLVDIRGKLRGMTLPLTKPCQTLTEVLDDPILEKGTNVDGSSLPGFANIENSDLHLHPIRETLRPIPNSFPSKVSVLCSLYNRGKNSERDSLFLGDSRNLLKNTIDTMFPEYQIKIKPEPEFYLLRSTTTGEIIPFDEGGYIDIAPADLSNNSMMQFANTLNEVGIKIHYHHHEVGPGQQEVEIAFDDILKNADDLVHLKPILKSLSRERGHDLTFMPKPFEKEAGSGLHVHFQLWKDGQNVLADPEKPGDISSYCKRFIAGILHHAKAISAIANPSINSYKRLVPGYEAPVYVTWGYRNRSTMVRVPMFRTPDKAAIEIRTPDFTANPYLLLTVLLAAGFDGVTNNYDPGDPRSDNVYLLSTEDITTQDIGLLPNNLGEAIEALEHDDVVLNCLGEHIGPSWLKILKTQWKEYNSLIITEYELNTYLDC